MDRDAELRLECLRMAREEGQYGDALIERAGQLYAFCNDGAVPRKQSRDVDVDKAWDAVETKLKQQPTEPIAKAVGKDGHFDKPFSDYLKPDQGRD